jgi:hypothetical protein
MFKKDSYPALMIIIWREGISRIATSACGCLAMEKK